jgi:hypothetical protein
MLAGCARQSNPEAEEKALVAAKAWLALVDEGRYVDSWHETAELMRAAVDRDAWEKTIRAVRAPLGKTVSREVKWRRYRTSLPGAPDGEYVILQFTTSFENKKQAVETVTPMLQEDGTWRVSGYYIK